MANETMVSSSQSTSGSSKTSEALLKLKRIREIKNSVIGNRLKKLQYLHVLPELHSIVSQSNDVELQVQALSAIGSLAYGVEDGARAVVGCDGVSSLVHALTHNDQRVVVAAARSLKLLLQSPAAPRDAVLQQPMLQRLIALLKQPPYPQVEDIAAHILCLCCTNEAQAQIIVGTGAVPALMELVLSTSGSSQEAAVEALATITHFSKEACQQLLSDTASHATCQQQQSSAAVENSNSQASVQQKHQQLYLPVVQQLLHLTRQHSGRIRYLCVSCISNIGRNVGDLGHAVQLQVADVCRFVLPYVARLLTAADSAAATCSSGHSACSGGSVAGRGQSRYLYQVPRVLAALIHDRSELLKLAVELDTISTLIRLLHSKAATTCPATSQAEHARIPQSASTASSPTVYKTAAAAAKAARLAAASAAAAAAIEDAAALRRGCLISLAALAMQGDEARQKMVEGGRLMAAVVPSLSDCDVDIRIAAADCLRGLSRSIRLLRCGSICDTVAGPLVLMLQDSQSTGAQVAAASAVCNLVLGFSSVRPHLIKSGVIPALVSLFSSMDPELRLHAVWAYKNLAAECSSVVQGLLMSELTWQGFQELLISDDDGRVQQQAYGLLQNLLCSGAESIDQVLKWSHNGLLPLLEDRLESSQFKQLVSAQASGVDIDAAPHLRTQLTCVLYAVNNVCSGSEAQKEAVMASKVPQLLLQYLCTKAICSSRASDSASDAACSSTHKAVDASTSSPYLGVHLAAVWCVINLLWCDKAAEGLAAGDNSSASVGQEIADGAARAAVLRQLGYERALKDILIVAHGISARNQAVAGEGTGGGVVSEDAGGAVQSCASSQDLIERVMTALEKLIR